MRRALIVGIDAYERAPLHGCVNDAKLIESVLRTNQDGSPNFECKTVTAPDQSVTRSSLMSDLRSLFENPADVAVFHFSGHGTFNVLGGFLVTQDTARFDEGIRMQDVLDLANRARANKTVAEIFIMLDCCHSGAFGNDPDAAAKAELAEGISILTAATDSQIAMEREGSGVFTSLFVDAVSGGAADVLGRVTVAGTYAYIDQALGAWDQRPLFKSHVSRLLPLRQCEPAVPNDTLRLLPKFFEKADAERALDPSYDPELEPFHEEHQEIYAHLQRLRNAKLLVPVGAPSLYHAAERSKACALTALGRYYWRLASEGRI
jgi:hypothetical protein